MTTLLGINKKERAELLKNLQLVDSAAGSYTVISTLNDIEYRYYTTNTEQIVYAFVEDIEEAREQVLELLINANQ